MRPGTDLLPGNRLVTISAPVFKCREDEQVFLSQLRAIPGFLNTIGLDGKYILALSCDEVNVPSKELQALCATWHTRFQLQTD